MEGPYYSAILSEQIHDALLFRNKHFEQLYLQGKISLELVPQGTLAERLRAHAAGLPAIFTPTGASTAVEEGAIPIRYYEGGISEGVMIPGIPKEHREFNGRRYVLEHAIAGDVAFVRAWKVDEVGNTAFRFVRPPTRYAFDERVLQVCSEQLQQRNGKECKINHCRGE